MFYPALFNLATRLEAGLTRFVFIDLRVILLPILAFVCFNFSFFLTSTGA
jgi:hypothetical protein